MTYEFFILLAGTLLIVSGGICLVRTYHILKIIIGLELMTKAATLFFVLAGHMNGNMALTQSFVITIIVIEVVVTLVASAVGIGIYKKYGSLDIRNIRNLKG